MSEHKRLYNLLQLVSLLGKPGGYPVKRLAERFQVPNLLQMQKHRGL